MANYYLWKNKNGASMSKAITILIPQKMRNDLQEISKSEGKPVNDIVIDSIKKYISVYRFHKLRNTTLPFAETQGILTDEDVYKYIS